MLKLTPILLALGYGLVMYLFSAFRLKQELNAQSTLLKDPRLMPLTQKMADAIEVKEIPVHVYEIDPINGLAAPDGRIFITRGFLKKFQAGEVSAEELASVIAHELGHVALGHSRRRMIDFSAQNAMRVGLGLILSRIIPGLGAYIANFLASMVMAGLSRKDEYEADAYASALLVKTGIGTAPQKSLFEKLEALTGARSAQVGWLMSHPKTTDRIEAIETLEAKWGLKA